MSIYVVYHAHCNDGFGAAWAVYQALGDSAIYYPCSYGEAFPPVLRGDIVYIYDFSFPREKMEEMYQLLEGTALLD